MFVWKELLCRLEELYVRIDDAYSDAASRGRFSCHGCDGAKCCTVDLILHTSIEQLHLSRGFNALEKSMQDEIFLRARQMVKEKTTDPYGDSYRDAICAVNSGGLCTLYRYRPMICRLAGIAHYIIRPDGRSVISEGCFRFRQDVEPHKPELRIDRTQFYRDMAQIELEVIRWLGKRSKARTVAEVLAEPQDLDPFV